MRSIKLKSLSNSHEQELENVRLMRCFNDALDEADRTLTIIQIKARRLASAQPDEDGDYVFSWLY